jgi:hypothetical protein
MTYDPQRPQRGTPQDPAKGSSDQHGAQSTEPQSRSYQPREEPRPVAHKPKRNRNLLFGVLGLVAVAGIIAGLTASRGTSTPTAAIRPHVPIRHIPAHAPVNHPTTTRRLIGTLNSTGSRTSGNFVVPSSTATAHYSYTCPAGTGASSFNAQLSNGSNSQIIARTSGTSGSQFVTVHPNAGGTYHISAQSRCPYRVQVYTNK